MPKFNDDLNYLKKYIKENNLDNNYYEKCYQELLKQIKELSITLEENAYVIYKIEVTNYGNTYVGIYSIEGLPENLDFEIIDYNLQEPLCNINGKCNNYATKVFYIKFSGSNTTETFTLNFNFKIFFLTLSN